MQKIQVPQYFIFYLFMSIILTACMVNDTTNLNTSSLSSTVSTSTDVCHITEPVWVKPPDDSAVSGSPEHGDYFVNKDRSIWASAWWTKTEGYHQAGEEGIKVGWFRPAGASLEITGQRIDGQAPPLEAHIPCCYPTQFQATGLIFPTEGCWEVTAKAADSELSFIVKINP